MSEYSNLNIFAKMGAITAELRTVAKNLDVKAGGGSYKAVSERDIIDAVKPLEEKYGIYSYPCDREVLESDVLESESTYNNKTTIKTTFFTRIKTTYMFVNIDNPDERIVTITFAEGIDSQDKGSGKAMTYSDKYALMKAYKISTGEDPDQNGSEDDHYRRTPRTGNSNNQRPKQQPIHCAECGYQLTDTTLRDGTVMSAAELANHSVRRYGAAYCAVCQKKRQEAAAAQAADQPIIIET